MEDYETYRRDKDDDNCYPEEQGISKGIPWESIGHMYNVNDEFCKELEGNVSSILEAGAYTAYWGADGIIHPNVQSVRNTWNTKSTFCSLSLKIYFYFFESIWMWFSWGSTLLGWFQSMCRNKSFTDVILKLALHFMQLSLLNDFVVLQGVLGNGNHYAVMGRQRLKSPGIVLHLAPWWPQCCIERLTLKFEIDNKLILFELASVVGPTGEK